MRYSKFLVLITIVVIIFTGCTSTRNDPFIISAPAESLYTSINIEGITVIPNGRLLTPAGKNLVVAPHPFGLALSRNGEIAVTANSGVKPLSISIIRNLNSSPEVIQVPPGFSNDVGVLESVFMGLAISPGNDKVYVANVGMFQYSKIGNIEETADYKRALDFPAYGYNTDEMRNGIISDSLIIPGLGSGCWQDS